MMGSWEILDSIELFKEVLNRLNHGQQLSPCHALHSGIDNIVLK